MGDITREFYETYLRKYNEYINMLDENIVISKEESDLFLAYRTNQLGNTIDEETLLKNRSAIIFFESIGLLIWDGKIRNYVLDPSKLAIKNIEYNRYKDSKESYEVKVKKLI